MFGVKSLVRISQFFESYLSTREIQPKSTQHKLRYRLEATALLLLVESLVKTVQHDEKQIGFSQLEKTRKILLETNKEHSIRLVWVDSRWLTVNVLEIPSMVTAHKPRRKLIFWHSQSLAATFLTVTSVIILRPASVGHIGNGLNIGDCFMMFCMPNFLPRQF